MDQDNLDNMRQVQFNQLVDALQMLARAVRASDATMSLSSANEVNTALEKERVAVAAYRRFLTLLKETA